MAEVGRYRLVSERPGMSEPLVATNVAPLPRYAEHQYVSTACLHGLHERCGTMQHDRGELGVPRCKFCDSPCACPVCNHDGGAS